MSGATIILNTGEELKGRTAKVYTIMDEYPKTRNSDWILMANYMHKYFRRLLFQDDDGDWCIKLKNLKHLCSWQSIRLGRQIIQNRHHLLLPTDPKVIKIRRIKEKNIRECEYREAVATSYKN